MRRSILPLLALTMAALPSGSGCTSAPWMVQEEVRKEPKVKYDATWWSDRSEENVRDQVFHRRKEMLEERVRQTEELGQQPENVSAPPNRKIGEVPLHPDPSQRLVNHPPPNQTWPQVTNQPTAEYSFGSNHGDAGHVSRIPEIESAVPIAPRGQVQLAQHLQTVSAQDRELPHNLPIGTDQRISDAVKLLGIIEDSEGNSLALLKIADQRTVHVRTGDVIEIGSAAQVLEASVGRISRDAVYLQSADNPNSMVIVR